MFCIMSYEFLEHTADVKFRAYGESVEEMFIAAAGALNETIRGNIKILEQEERVFEVEEKDLESLLSGLIETCQLLGESDYDPVLMATLIAFGFVFIHPFEDGNGRIHVSRP